MPEPVSRLAPAKINLYLHVTARRPDGYHLIDSLFAFTDFGDRIDVRSGADGIRLAIQGPFAGGLSAGPDNLVIKAAQAIAGFGEGITDAGADIRLTKILPVASGIGGGSSDAAATLHALNRFWELGANLEELTVLAIKLGADVPACLHGVPVQASGIGERLEPAVALPPCAVVLVNPGSQLLTVDVFKAFAEKGLGSSTPAPLTAAPGSVEDLAEAMRARYNDLESVAATLVPAISEVLEALTDTPGCLLARLSGSGPTCFGLFPSADAATRGARTIAAKWPGWWVQSGSLAGEQ